MTGPGLGIYWGQVIDVLEQIIPVYDKVNSYISLGRDTAHRERGIKNSMSSSDTVLDAGSGFGNMSLTAIRLHPGITVTLYDPLMPMLKSTSGRFEQIPDMSCGVFESMPFGDKNFDAMMCGYSLRDAIDLRQAISEAHRILKDGGRLVIVDLGKPDCAVVRLGVSIYLRAVLPLVALVAGGRLGLKFATLYGTYRRWPQNAELKKLLLEKFKSVDIETDLMGGAIMVTARR